MDHFKNKPGKRGGKEVGESAAAEERRQCVEASSHARVSVRQTIAGRDEERAGPSGVPVPAPRGAKRPDNGPQQQEGRLEEGVPSPPPARKRRRESEGGMAAANPFKDSTCEWDEGPSLWPASRLQRWLGERALHRLGAMYFRQPEFGQKGKGARSAPLSKDSEASGRMMEVKRALENLYRLADDSALSKRVGELEGLVDSLKKELGRVRVELLRAKMADSDACPVEERSPSEAAPAGRVSARGVPRREEEEDGWTTVVRKGKGRGAGPTARLREGVVNAPPPGTRGLAPPLTRKEEARKGQKGVRGAPSGGKGPGPAGSAPKKGRLKVPRNPAVLVTAVGEGTYASLLKKARDEVDLADIGILDAAGRLGLVTKRARNGGYLFEVTGADGVTKADRFARELEEALGGVAKVARPVKLAEVRVTGLADDVTPEMVATALMSKGGCSRDAIVLGEIRRAPGGLGAIWVRCPVAVAKKAADGKGLRIGWTQAGVQVLEERPLQCYRCLKYGHLAAACRDPRDLKGRCFRCGGAGHIARGCTAELRCLPCEKAGWSAGHRMGGRACQAASAAWQKKGGCPAPLRAPVIAPGRGRGRGLPPPDEAMGAGAGGDFVAPTAPAPRRRKRVGSAKPPPPTAQAEEVQGAGEAIEVLSCSQVLPESLDSGRMAVEEEEEVAAISSLLLEEDLMGEWGDETSQMEASQGGAPQG